MERNGTGTGIEKRKTENGKRNRGLKRKYEWERDGNTAAEGFQGAGRGETKCSSHAIRPVPVPIPVAFPKGVVGVRDRVTTSGILQPRGFHGGWIAIGVGIGGNRAIKGSKRVGWRYGLGVYVGRREICNQGCQGGWLAPLQPRVSNGAG